MLVRDIMTTPAHSLSTGTSVEEAINLLVTASISSVPIVDDHLSVVGILTEADVLRVGLEPDTRATLMPRPSPIAPWPENVDAVMTPDPRAVQPTSDVADVAALMGEHGWKSLPVTQHDALVGVVSRSDILRALHTSDIEIQESVRSALDASGQPEWAASVTLGIVRITGPSDTRQEHLARSVATAIPGVRRVSIAT